MREKHKYSGPAVLILDGCSSHFTSKIFEVCYDNQVKVLFLPPHSSNQTQTLDLGIFHLHKDFLRKFVIVGEDEKALVQNIKDLYSSFQSVANLEAR